MTVRGRWYVTPHAVKRYQERIDPEAGYAAARDQLLLLAAGAQIARADLRQGVEHYTVPEAPGIYLVVRRAGPGGGPLLPGQLPALVTIIDKA